jgi:hypothetical protein
MADITRTVGSGGYYATLAEAIADLPSTLSDRWILQLKNQEHTTSGRIYKAFTASATNYLWITAESGAEFWANSSNPLRYGYGARVLFDTGTNPTGDQGWLDLEANYTRVSNIQIRATKGINLNSVLKFDGSDCMLDRCLVESTGSNPAQCCVMFYANRGVAVNSIIIHSGTTTSISPYGLLLGKWTSITTGGRAYNCTLLRPTDSPDARGTAIVVDYGSTTSIVSDCVVMGAWSSTTYRNAASWSASSGRIVTSLADGTSNSQVPGTGNTFSVSASQQLTGVTNAGGLDARLKSGFTSYTGQRNQTQTNDVDIFGQARSTTAPQIGAQESIPAGADTQAPNVPTGVTATGATESSFNTGCDATTDNGGGSVSGYKVRLYDSSDTVLSTVDKGNTRTHTFSGLSAGTLYKAAWSAYDDATPSNNSAYSSPVSITTNAMMAFASSTPAVSAVAAAGTMTMTGTSRQFQITLYQEDGATPLAGRTGLWYAWWPSIAAAQTQAASIYGTGASTNGSGQITFAAPSALSIGNNQGYGVISDQDATPDSAEIAYVGSFDVI